MRCCPDVYQVNATRASLSFWPVDPTANPGVVLYPYVDPRIRVFVSPIESDSVVGDWEDASLVVVQVRSDLVTGQDLLDLR
jgi:hypothetical protein